MKKSSLKKRIGIILLTLITMLMFSSTAFAIWWATPGYEWALSNGLTKVKTNTQLKQTVALSDFYTITVKYLKMKGISPRDETIQHEDNMDGIDNVAKGVFEIINGYNSRDSLTIQQYYIVENYIEHARNTLDQYIEYSQYLTRDSLKNIDLYLALSKYKAATLIGNRNDREYVLSKIGNVKNSEILQYHILPYAENITRKEFLLVMYDLISATEKDNDAVINAFKEAGVLVGFDTGLELDKKITYSEMFTFLYRFEIFDFEQSKEIE